MLDITLSDRQGIRLKIPENNVVEVDINGENFIDRLTVRDISENGIGVTVPHDFKGCFIGGLVNIILKLPDPEEGYLFIQAQGRIRHVANHYFGASFLSIQPEDRECIKQFIQKALMSDARSYSEYAPIPFLHKINTLLRRQFL